MVNFCYAQVLINCTFTIRYNRYSLVKTLTLIVFRFLIIFCVCRYVPRYIYKHNINLLFLKGDIAILLHSGLTMKKALFYNFLAAIVCYGGLIVGIVVGENTDANRWIFAFAGGLFIYIALVDMVCAVWFFSNFCWKETNVVKGDGVFVFNLLCQYMYLS